MPYTLTILEAMPACDLPGFPLWRRVRKGHPFWAKKIRGKSYAFGSCTIDTTGNVALGRYIEFIEGRNAQRAAELAGIPRDRNHPDFPLFTKTLSTCESWYAKIANTSVAYGSLRCDPTGALAWKLYENELPQRIKGINPRKDLDKRRVRARAWLLAAPLSKVGIAIMDHSTLRAVCTKCAASWRIGFTPSTWEIPRRFLRCPQGCTPIAPLDEVREMVLASVLPSVITVPAYERLVQARRNGWMAAPCDIDSEAEAEGKSLAIFISQYAVHRKPRRKVQRAARLTSWAGTNEHKPVAAIPVPAMHEKYAKPLFGGTAHR